MSYDFYYSREYRERQSVITKENWRKGLFDFHYKREKRICAREGCNNIFEVKLSDPKVYCSSSCAAKINNVKRGPQPEEVRLKISKALKGRKNPHGGTNWGPGERISKIEIVCANPHCRKVFVRERWMHAKFCSNKCAMKVVGGRPTSPKAARGKAGIREDIDKDIYFYSRWEANIARLFNYLGIEWLYQPKTFDLKTQTYTPDFYLPKYDIYIEVKNFMWKYSKIRDKKFRNIYPNIILILLLKKDYLEIEKEYSPLIKTWEYKNTPFDDNKK